MNFIFTTLWLFLATLGSYFLAKTFFPEQIVLVMICGFFLALLLRFCGRIFIDILEGVVDAVT